MTIEKLARFIVDDWYTGTPLSERHQVAVEDQIKQFKLQIAMQSNELKVVSVYVDVKN